MKRIFASLAVVALLCACGPKPEPTPAPPTGGPETAAPAETAAPPPEETPAGSPEAPGSPEAAATPGEGAPAGSSPEAATTPGAGESPQAAAGGEAQTLPSGVKYTIQKEGTGAVAERGNTVSVHYTGWLVDGTKFDSSLDSGRPFDFTLGAGQVIPGWDSGVEGMKVGEKRRLEIPPDQAYGAQGTGPIPPNATLVFEVELLDVKK